MTSNCRKSLRFVFQFSAYGAERPFSLVIVSLKVKSRIFLLRQIWIVNCYVSVYILITEIF